MRITQWSAAALFLGLAFNVGAARAELNAVEAGIKGPNVAGEKALTLQNKLGFGVSAYVGQVATGTYVVGSVDYQPYGVKNATGITLNFINVLLGAQLRGGKQVLGIAPAIALQAGMAYGWLGFSDVTGNIQNSKIYFTGVATPSLEFPIWQNLSGAINLPVQIIADRPSNLATFSESLTLRWTL